jgi:DNA-binding NtrC family response regulator
MNASTGPHVLLVDDEVEFLSATQRALERRGFDVTTATNGQAALEMVEHRAFDVVVLDGKMPGLSGEQVFHELRARWPDLPVVMLTGHGTIREAFETSKKGLYEYLSKPCDVDGLAALLRRAGQVEDPASVR